MEHASDTLGRLAELRKKRPLLLVAQSDEVEGASFRILDKPNTPFWWAWFGSELEAREAFETWMQTVGITPRIATSAVPVETN